MLKFIKNKKTFLFNIFLLMLILFPAISIANTGAFEGPTEEMMGKAGLSNFSLDSLVITMISAILSLLGIIFFALIFISGYQWMTAGGNEETVKKAQGRLTKAIIGLIIVLAAYIITYFVFSSIPFGAGESPSNGGMSGS